MSDALSVGKLQFHFGQNTQMTKIPEPFDLLRQGAGLLRFCSACLSKANLLKERRGWSRYPMEGKNQHFRRTGFSPWIPILAPELSCTVSVVGKGSEVLPARGVVRRMVSLQSQKAASIAESVICLKSKEINSAKISLC